MGLLVLVLGLALVRAPVISAPFSREGEAREAEMLADVVRHGHWLAPYPNGDWIPTKGPFLYWWTASFASVLGLTETTVRLSVVVLALATLACTAALGTLLGSARVGWVAAAVLATSFPFWKYTVTLRVDPALTFCVTLSILGFAWSLGGGRRRVAGTLLSHVALAGACLTKGLPALLPTLPTYLAVLAIRRDWSLLVAWLFTAALAAGALLHPALWILAGGLALARLRMGSGGASVRLVDLVPGVLFSILTVGWVQLADARYPISYVDYVIGDSLSRVGHLGAHGPSFLKPRYWYVQKLAGDFFPWVLFLPAGLLFAIARLRRSRLDRWWIPLLWFVGTFVLFSLAAYKRKAYLLPLYPAAALLVAAVLTPTDGEVPPEGPRRWRRVGRRALALVGAGLTLAALGDLGIHLASGLGWLPRGHQPWMVAAREWRVFTDLGLAGVGGLWASNLRAAGAGATRVLAGQTVLLLVVGALMSAGVAKTTKEPRLLAESIAEIVPPTAELRFAPGVRDHALLFYLDRRILATSRREVKRVLREGPGQFVYFLGPGTTFLPSALRQESVQLLEGEGSFGHLLLLRVPRQVGPGAP